MIKSFQAGTPIQLKKKGQEYNVIDNFFEIVSGFSLRVAHRNTNKEKLIREKTHLKI
jgi:hypothetical protein